MSPPVAVAALVLFSVGGAALAQAPLQWVLLLSGVLLAWAGIARQQRWTARQMLLVLLLLLLSGMRGGLAAQLSPGSLDPLHHLNQSRQVRVLEGQWQRDATPLGGSCRSLMRVRSLDGTRVEGLTEVVVTPCSQRLPAGAWLRLEGELRRPARAVHSLLSSPSQRLARLGCWTQFRARGLNVLGQGWTPLADARRRIQSRFHNALGNRDGALLAALVLGGSQVVLPDAMRQSFRVAGLSHALAASGFHLSVLLGSVLLLTRRWPRGMRLGAGGGAMALFLALAGAQASVVRAVLMGGAALMIREFGGRTRPLGVLLASLVLMLWWHPQWAQDIGFQFSAAATAGLVVSAPWLEVWLQTRWPRWARGFAAALAVPLAALTWTLPLQWLHFGAMPLYSLVANLLASPLLMALTLLAMGMAVVALLLPPAVAAALLSLVAVPVRTLEAVLQWMVLAISHWPWAQLLTGRPAAWIVGVVVLALLACCLRPSRQMGMPLVLVPLAMLALGLHGAQRLADDVVRVEQWGRQWVLLLHQGRMALISRSGDALSCRIAQQLGQGLGQSRFDWVALLDPVATDQQPCWRKLARTVVAEQLGQRPLLPGQRLMSPGLVLTLSDADGRGYLVRAGRKQFKMRGADLRLMSVRRRPLQ